MTKKRLIILVLVLIIAFFASNPRFYSGLNAGIAWDVGGIEIKGNPGIFLCEGSLNPKTGEYWHNPLADLLPELVVDC